MRKSFLDKDDSQLSIRRQAELLQINRNRLQPKRRKVSQKDQALRLEIDQLHLLRPFFGSRSMCTHFQKRGHQIGRGKVRRLMREMGIVAIYPKPRTSVRTPEHKVYPYLLRRLKVNRPNQAWCADITYIPLGKGFAYLIAIMDWHSRAVLGWRISNTMDTDFCVEALRDARAKAGCWPEIMNTDQGSQFTSDAWTKALKDAEVRISMDGKGRWIDNVFIERLWRSLKYEDIYLREYLDLGHLQKGVASWMHFYNHERYHQSLNDETPWSVWQGGLAA
jgi:putative transposase